MNYQHMFRGIAGVTLSLVLLGLLSLTAYAAGPPAPEDAYQAIPAADHCGISSDMTGSSLLAANPELSAACRFASMKLEQQAMVAIPLSYLAGPAGAGTMDEAQRARQAETARYSGLAEAYASRTEMSDSRFLAENPEVMKAGRFTKTESNVSLQQKTDTIQRFGVAEFLAAERDTVSARPVAISNIRRLEMTNENRV